jgi:hypothetical protein
VVGEVRCWQEGLGSWPFPTLPGSGFARWFVSCPIAQPGSVWRASLHRRVGPFREDLRFVMDYEFWLRLRFDLGVTPFHLARPVARYRLHPESKTVSASEQFAGELVAVLARHEAALSRVRRARVWAARRSRRGRILGRKGVALVREGRIGPGLRSLGAAFRAWPPLVLGPAVFLGMKALVTGKVEEPHFPEMWPT